jgi:hypothetical protein
MKFRKLRITFSALCAIVALLLIVFWMQSYSGYVYLAKRLTKSVVSVQTDRGELSIWSADLGLWHSSSPDATWAFDYRRGPVNNTTRSVTDGEPALELLGFRYQSIPPIGSVLFVPFWALLLPVIEVGVLALIKWRLSWRIAASTFAVLLTVLLISLWIRSYEVIETTNPRSPLNICSMRGKLFVGERLMQMSTMPGGRKPIPGSLLGICSMPLSDFELVSLGGGVALPYWLIVLLAAPLAAIPWLRCRFSLRTMLVAIALISVFLCLIAFALKN